MSNGEGKARWNRTPQGWKRRLTGGAFRCFGVWAFLAGSALRSPWTDLSGVEWRTAGFGKCRFQGHRSTPFNPDNRCVEYLGLRKGPDFFLSPYVGFQGDFLKLRWQLDVMATAEWTGGWDGRVAVKQCFFQKDLSGNGILVVGRSIQRWGTGYAFSPTDLAAPDKELSDPDNEEKRAEGSDLIKIELFGRTYSAAACILTDVKAGTKITMRSARLAFHFYKSLRDVDVSCMALFTGDATPVWGANFSTVIGKRLEIHGEAAFQKGCHAMVHPAAGEPFTLYLEDPLIDSIKNSRRIAAQVLLGFQFTFPGDILWVSEYFHRDQGYTRKEWKRLVSYADTLNTRLTSPSGELAFANLLWTLDVFSPKGAMRDYLMNHVRLTVFRDIALRCTVLANLSDFSRVLVPEAELGMGNRFAFYVRIFIFQGSGKSEFGTFYQSYTLEGGMRLR